MEHILFEKRDHIARITLNRPKQHNAYTAKMSYELSEAMKECDSDDDVRCVLITGSGDSFCVGMDLNEVSQQAGDNFEMPQLSQRTYPFQIRKPVICAINGRAGGFGIAYPLTCDIRLIAEDATVAFSFVRSGLLPEMGASWLLPKLVGVEAASRLLLTGNKITGREAEQMGLVSQALPREEVLAATEKMALDIAANVSPGCVAYTKRLLWQRLTDTGDLHDAIVADRDHFSWSMNQPDSREGAMAFMERRKPRWQTSVSRDLPAFLSE